MTPLFSNGTIKEMASEIAVQQEVQELTQAALRNVKIEEHKIDAHALVKIATNATTKGVQKKLLCACLERCPSLDKRMSECYFGRRALCPALTVEGAYRLMIALGGTHKSIKIKNSCHAIGIHMLSNKKAASELFEHVCLDIGEQQNIESDANEMDYFQEARVRGEATDMATMNRLQATANASLVAVQLQKELTGGVIPIELQQLAQDAIEQIQQAVATKGTHDAIDLLKMLNHSDWEARKMASSFGRFLAAARLPAHYTPNTRHVRFGILPSSCNGVALYNPKVHADIIMPAYESFKKSARYAECLEEGAEYRRHLRRRHMQVMDIAGTHSMPREGLMLEDNVGQPPQLAV
jgi:hypothetical protein